MPTNNILAYHLNLREQSQAKTYPDTEVYHYDRSCIPVLARICRGKTLLSQKALYKTNHWASRIRLGYLHKNGIRRSCQGHSRPICPELWHTFPCSSYHIHRNPIA